MTTFRARDIARWFIAWAENVDAEVSNLKLQKLLYYAQGHRLGATGEPLFSDPIQAWAHGPVVAEVYHAYKDYGKNPIDPDVALGEDFDWDDFAEVSDLLGGRVGPLRVVGSVGAAGAHPSRGSVEGRVRRRRASCPDHQRGNPVVLFRATSLRRVGQEVEAPRVGPPRSSR